MEKVDFKNKLKQLYQPSSKQIEEVNVPPMKYLMADGEGDPETAPAFAEVVEALFSLSYTLKFMVKKGALEIDYSVMPLEGLWWADDMSAFSSGDKSKWKWTLMIMQPEFITKEMVAAAIAEVKKKKNLAALNKVRFEALAEGNAAQIMHIGPFSEEGPNIERLHQYIESHGHKLSGKHHEIYMSDIRKTAPQKWKTVIRQPML
ncbi:MAG TPA: GyrI-like domain-containing protein [Gallionellaceae bacterium]|nr:GyrI-like domain-containing protein [Gallionellaceae bacterium]